MSSLALTNFIYFKLLDEKFRPDITYSTGKLVVSNDTIRVKWDHIIPTHIYLDDKQTYNEIFTEAIKKFGSAIRRDLMKYFQLQYVCPDTDEMCLKVKPDYTDDGSVRHLMVTMALPFMSRPKYIVNELRRPNTPPPTNVPPTAGAGASGPQLAPEDDGMFVWAEDNGGGYESDDMFPEEPIPAKKRPISESESDEGGDDDSYASSESDDVGLVANAVPESIPSTTASITNRFKRAKLIDRSITNHFGEIMSLIGNESAVKSDLMARLSKISQTMLDMRIKAETISEYALPPTKQAIDAVWAMVQKEHTEDSIQQLFTHLYNYATNLTA